MTNLDKFFGFQNNKLKKNNITGIYVQICAFKINVKTNFSFLPEHFTVRINLLVILTNNRKFLIKNFKFLNFT